jgi:hypothetical protein
MSILKGEQEGDEYLWNATCIDPKTGDVHTGVWKSYLEKNQNVGVAER